MPIRTLWSGAWQGPVADGNVRLKWGGSSWISPAAVRMKTGSTVGAEVPPFGGGWTDTQYHGYPNPPSVAWVNAWGYGNLQAAWNYAAAGGAAIAYYHVVLTDVNGAWLSEENSTDNVSPNWTVAQDTRYMVYVRSVAVNGLASPFQGPLKVGIGHPSTPNYGYVQRTRPWYSQINGNWYKDAYNGGEGGTVVFVPNTVLITEFHVNMVTNNSFSSVISPWNNRTMSHIFAGADWTDVIQANNPYSGIEYGFNNWGGDNYWGYILRGAGWTVSPGGVARCVGQFGVAGNEYYNNYEVVSWNPEQGNYYW